MKNEREARTGNLILSVRAGRSVYVGRDVKVTILKIAAGSGFREVTIEAPVSMAVSGGDRFTFEKHLQRTMQAESDVRCEGLEDRIHVHRIGNTGTSLSVFIGRSTRVVVGNVGDDGSVEVAIEAPKFRAISRDDVSFEKHLEFCAEKEGRVTI